MAKQKNPSGRIRLVYRRSSMLLKCMVLVTILLSTAALLALTVSLQQVRRETEDLRSQAAQLEEENDQLEQDISLLGTIESIKKIAAEQLGLVDPDTEFFSPTE